MSSQPLAPPRSLHPIPMVDLSRQHAEISEEILESFSEILTSGRFVLGDAVTNFESALARHCDTRFATTCNSGTDALWLALRSLGIGEGDAVLCPAFSFFATAAAIARTGAVPIFVDIDPETFNLDPEDAIRCAENTPNLKAVLTADLFGRIANIEPLANYCSVHGIPIIEDAAQSIDALDRLGRGPGQGADMACLSFYPTKNLGALGDAGAVVTNNRELADRIAQMRVHGQDSQGLHSEIGINSRMDSLQAAALLIKLKHLPGWTKTRGERAALYDRLFAENGAGPNGSLPILTPPPVPAPGCHSYHRYVIRVPAAKRPMLITALQAEGIASEIYYPLGLHQQPAFAPFLPSQPKRSSASASSAPETLCPETERAAQEALAIPLYPELDPEDIERVVRGVIRAI